MLNELYVPVVVVQILIPNPISCPKKTTLNSIIDIKKRSRGFITEAYYISICDGMKS